MSGMIVAPSFVDNTGDEDHLYNPWGHLKKNAASHDPDLIYELKNVFKDLEKGPALFEQFKSCRPQAVIGVLTKLRNTGYPGLVNRVEQNLPNCLCP